MKQCKMCKFSKPLDAFHIELKGKFGRKSKCSECCTSLSRAWKQNNQERERENRKRWNAANVDRHKESTYRWRDKNRKAHNEYVAEWQRLKKASDPQYKMLSTVRTLVSNHFKRRSLCKIQRLESLLDIKWEDFYNKMLNMLEDGMTEENYGSYWSFDHVCPCAVAKDQEELERLQHWSNWRPMVHKGPNGNLSKQDKITEDAVDMCRKLLNREP